MVSRKPIFPRNQAASQAKTPFSLMGGFVPIFRPLRAGCCSQPGRKMSCLKHHVCRITCGHAARRCSAPRAGSRSTATPRPASWSMRARGAPSTGSAANTEAPSPAPIMEVLEAMLWGFHNSKSGLCFPSYEAIAEKAQCCRDTVYEAIRALEAADVLTWVNRIVREQVRERDLFGKWGTRWRIIRTSNAYLFRDPLPCSEGRGSN